MEEVDTFLMKALRDVIAGGDIAGEQLHAGIPDGRTLRGARFKAWYGLIYWVNEADIREKDPSYAPMRRKSLAELLRRLEAEISG
jgi:hypothetical protein